MANKINSIAIPSINEPLVDENGRITPVWYKYITSNIQEIQIILTDIINNS